MSYTNLFVSRKVVYSEQLFHQHGLGRNYCSIIVHCTRVTRVVYGTWYFRPHLPPRHYLKRRVFAQSRRNCLTLTNQLNFCKNSTPNKTMISNAQITPEFRVYFSKFSFLGYIPIYNKSNEIHTFEKIYLI